MSGRNRNNGLAMNQVFYILPRGPSKCQPIPTPGEAMPQTDHNAAQHDST